MRRRNFVRDERGAAMVEFAIVLPVLVVLVLAIIDFGRLLFLYNNLANAVREGARFAAVQQPDPCTTTAKGLATARVQNYIATFGGTAASGSYTVTATCIGSPTQQVQLTVSGYPFQALTPLPFFSGVAITESAIFRWEGSASP
ncbi:MAG TPA: TadE/TadG family type IV pilus assembly protein [Gemmatimonadaceae bacterium]|nr:TadE/TadG family type IV pilus assembly protein [Gemmatimonadaceae bacterium]